jgi:hypothetical protein
MDKDSCRINARVAFDKRGGKWKGRKIGTIVKCNRKCAKIFVQVGEPKGVWTVPYWLIKKATKHDITLLAISKLEKLSEP